MSNESNRVLASAVKSQEQSAELMEKLFAVAQPGAVYSEPVTSGEFTVITASEVTVAAGFGYGIGSGTSSEPAEGEAATGEEARGLGGGGGGGGVSAARPVATISIGPRGVRVEPVVDVTKIGLALFTTLGAMLMMLGRMRRLSRS